MNSTNNCCDKISGEHWLSKNILEQLPELKIIGLPGSKDKVKKLGPKALTANILCKRHNSALSPLDTAAGNAFGNLTKAIQHIKSRIPNRKNEREFLIDGFAIELWALKVLTGIHVGGISSLDGEATRNNLQFDVAKAAQFLSGAPIDFPLGLYYYSEWLPNIAAGLTPMGVGDKLGGLKLTLQDFTVDCIFSTPNGPDEFQDHKPRHRPAIVQVTSDYAVSTIYFAWQKMKAGDSVIKTRWPSS